MRNWKLWVGAVVLILLVARLVYKFSTRINKISEERAWYVHQLHYDFSIAVDTVIMRNNAKVGAGKVFGTVTRGTLRTATEDSLGAVLKYHKSLRFNQGKKDNRLVLTTPMAGDCVKGDSIVINSEADQVVVFQKGVQKRKGKLSVSLAGQPIVKKKGKA